MSRVSEWQEVGPPAEHPAKLKLLPHLNFIDFSEGGKCLLGSSDLVRRTHTGILWLFADLTLPADSEASLARHNCDSPLTCGAFLTEEVVIVAEDTGSVITYLLNESDQITFVHNSRLTPHDSWINSLSVCSGADDVVTGGADARICVLSDKGSTMKINYHPAHGQSVSCVAASLVDASVFASSSMDRSTLLWDTRLSKPAEALMEGGCGYTALAWKDENHIAIGSESGMVHIHDVRASHSVQDIPLHNAAVRKLAFSKSGLLASSSYSCEVRLWNFETGKMIFPETKHQSFISDLAWDKREALYSCGFDGHVFSHPLS